MYILQPRIRASFQGETPWLQPLARSSSATVRSVSTTFGPDASDGLIFVALTRSPATTTTTSRRLAL